MMSRMSTGSLEIVEERGESWEMLLWWGSMRQGRSSVNIGQESSEDDRRDELCVVRQVEGLVYLRFALRLVLSKASFA